MILPALLHALAALFRHGPRSEVFRHAAAALGFAWRWWYS